MIQEGALNKEFSKPLQITSPEQSWMYAWALFIYTKLQKKTENKNTSAGEN